MKLSEIVRRKEGIVSILSGFLALVLLLGYGACGLGAG